MEKNVKKKTDRPKDSGSTATENIWFGYIPLIHYKSIQSNVSSGKNENQNFGGCQFLELTLQDMLDAGELKLASELD